jgi:putative FmdB family regulatory protein
MPIYEYRCTACGRQVEVFVRSSSSEATCPICGKLLTEKLFSVPHILSAQARRPTGQTCCGQEERCDRPPCDGGGGCRHH